MATRKTTSEKAIEAKPAQVQKKPVASRAKTPAPKPTKAAAAKATPEKLPKGAKGIKRDTSPLRKNRSRAQVKADEGGASSLMAEFPAPPELYKEMGLSFQEAIFVEQFLIHFNQTKAYMAAYPACKSAISASANSSRLAHRPHVVAYRDARMKAMFERAEEEQDRLIRTYTMSAYADPNELVEHRRDACRFCYGNGHKYQFTPAEFELHKEEYAEEVKVAKVAGINPPEFDPKGGIGFNPNSDPSEDCPECFGRGHSQTIIKDTRFLSPAALSLYAGMKESKDGIEIKMNSQEKSREVLAKITKLFDDSANVNVSFDVQSLEERFTSKMEEAHERQRKVMQERDQRQSD